MTKKTKSILLFGVPLVIGAYLIYTQLKGSGTRDVANGGNGNGGGGSTGGGNTNPAPSSFPLKKGSKNTVVGTVQALLNSAGETLTVDNNFGSKTEAALLKVFGKKTIDNQADLDRLRAKIATASQTSSNLDWGWKLIDAAANPANTKLMVKKEVNLQGVNKNFLNQWVSNNKAVKMSPRNYTLNDYKLRSAQNNGQLRIEIVTGALAGMYITPVGTDLKATFDIIA
jgi:hypothetical protein